MEYIIVLAVASIFAIKITEVFAGIFQDGVSQLERNAGQELQTGRGFGGQD